MSSENINYEDAGFENRIDTKEADSIIKKELEQTKLYCNID